MHASLLRSLTPLLLLSCFWSFLGCQGGGDDSGNSACLPPTIACGDTCSDTSSDPNHCGSCETECPEGSVCTQGKCGICPANSLNCGTPCGDTNTDPNHCGACGSPCAEGQVCEAAKCMIRCDAPRLRCGDLCVDQATDAAHCGMCGATCAAGEVCLGGNCECGPGFEVCGTSCVNLKADPLHCGMCGTSCAASEVCVGGNCECGLGLEVCGDSCVNLKADPLHCGSCSNPCAIDRTCEGGECKCGGVLPNECAGECTNFQSDAQHCGTCDTQCETFESCQAGRCKYEGDGCGGTPLGVDLVRVALYQAVEVDLFRDGKALAANERNTHVIQNRDALVRGFVELPSGSERRSISMRVVVQNDDQTEVLFQRRTVDGTSVQADLGSTFVVEVPARLIAEHTAVSLDLASCDESGTSGELGTTHLPSDGSMAELAAMKTGRITLMVVPLTHEGITPSFTEAAVAPYVEGVMQQYPVEGVDVTTLDPIASGFVGPRPDLGKILDTTLFAKRQTDAPSLDTYYYGLIRPTVKFGDYCVGSCTAGIGYVTGAAGQDAADYRIALGVAYDDQMSWDVLPHELGHNHGRDHAPCSVPDGDPKYPYKGASIGSWGYSATSLELLAPTTHVDFMSYCTPTWISDYTFEALAQRAARVNMYIRTPELRIGAPRLWWSILSTQSGRSWSHPRTGWDAMGEPLKGWAYDANLMPLAEVELSRIQLSEGGGSVLLVPPPSPGWFAVGAVGEDPFPYPPVSAVSP